VPRLERCDPARHRRNRATAAATAEWMDRYFTSQQRSLRRRLSPRRVRDRVEGLARRQVAWLERHGPPPVARAAGWSRRQVAGRASRSAG
jgi:hypothetical protein